MYTTLFFYLKFQLLYEMTKIPFFYIINEELYNEISCPYIITLLPTLCDSGLRARFGRHVPTSIQELHSARSSQ